MLQQGFPHTETELRAWLRLSHTTGIGPSRGRLLLQRFGAAEAILDAGFGELAQLLQSVDLAGALLGADPTREAAVTNALRWLQETDASRAILTLGDPRYPPRLLDLADPPLLLYCIGDLAWLGRPQIAIVGSRNATALGSETARDLAHCLAASGWTVASGLAEGIDRAAHLGALDALDAGEMSATGSTVAALGTGIDRVYPSRNRALARDIARFGALVSELPVGTPPVPANFPRRNRLIAALAHGVLVVEANPRSGSLITARLAADLGRDVLAVPGSIHSPLARGCNSLIRQGAKLVESVDDILAELPPIHRLGLRSTFETGSMPPMPTFGAELSATDEQLPHSQARVLSAMSADPVMPETIAARQCLTVASTLAALQTLELNGLVERQLDGAYIRRP